MSVKCWASVAGAGLYSFSPSRYFMLGGAHAHSAWRAAAGSKMEVLAYFTSVHIPSFGRAVTGNAADSKMEVSAHFTSVHILSFGRAVTGKKSVVTPAKRNYILDLLVATIQHCYIQDRNEWDTQTMTDRLSGQR